jgi:16S rRNA (adenine1518-N6/adenine1519-N6)-dimethyltransferase
MSERSVAGPHSAADSGSGPSSSRDGLLGAGEIRRLAEELQLRPTKQRGQNFVIDGNTVRRIVATAELTAEDVVLEVGPGLGSLTLGLLPVVRRVVAVEIDATLARTLPVTVQRRRPDLAARLEVVTADALQVTSVPGPPPTAMVANLPYNVAVPVLLTLLARLPSIVNVLVMVQAEVADRLAAEPGSRIYGVPSVKARWYGDVRRAGTIGRTVFWPAPNVDSGLVALRRTSPPETTATRAEVFAVIDAAFAQRRKTLRSALGGWAGSPAAAEAALRASNVPPGERGEQLTVADFARIAEHRTALADLATGGGG